MTLTTRQSPPVAGASLPNAPSSEACLCKRETELQLQSLAFFSSQLGFCRKGLQMRPEASWLPFLLQRHQSCSSKSQKLHPYANRMIASQRCILLLTRQPAAGVQSWFKGHVRKWVFLGIERSVRIRVLGCTKLTSVLESNPCRLSSLPDGNRLHLFQTDISR